MMFTRWNAKRGYREALNIGLPLVVTMMSNTVMTFTDRIFLGNYSLEALAASVPAAIAAFLFLSFFLGVAEYTGVFISQYTGSARPLEVGRALWQGIWFCVPAGLFLAAMALIAEPLFDLGGHPLAVRELEVVYFQILTIGGAPFLLGACLSSFFAGRGMTKPIMVVSVCATIVNVPLDYCLINGLGPFPEMGIVGAGIATVIGFTLPLVTYGLLIFTRRNEECFRVLSSWRVDAKLMRRFLKFGLPGGVQFFLDIFAISFFVFIVGRLGQLELAATNAVFSIYSLAFLPTIGLHIAASIMVGQAMGERNPDGAAYATGSVFQLALGYMIVMAVIFVLMPNTLMELFRTRNETALPFGEVSALGVVLLRYAAVFTLLDAVAIVFIGGLKGAGDTRFTMLVMGASSILCMVIPLTILSVTGFGGIHGPWICLLVYIGVLSITMWNRFRKGPWRNIEVIEHS